MSVEFYQHRPPEGAAIACLDTAELELINSALTKAGSSVDLDPYGDTKLLGENVKQIISILPNGEHSSLLSKLNKLASFEVVYGYGE